MEKLKALFGSEALTWEQLEAKLKDNKEIKLANLAEGGYVDKKKFEDKEAELTTANNTIKGLKDTVAKFDGVDLEKLKKDASDWETKYNTDIAAVKLDSDIFSEAVKRHAKNPKLVASMIDKTIVKRDGDKLLGLSEQFDNIVKSDAYLFDADDGQQGGARVNTGANHNNNTNTDAFMSAFRKGAGLEADKKE